MSADKSSVNQRSISAFVILAPLLLITSLLVFPSGCGSGGGGGVTATPLPTPGAVQIGFTDSPSNGFQNILFNIVSVRLNPSTDSTVSDGDPNWVTITVPPGLGAVGQMQIDLNPLQNNSKLFNTALVPAQTYNQVEVLIDQTNPGSIVPSCSLIPPVSEGCVTYGMQFGSGTTLRTTAQVSVTANGLTPVIIDLNPGTPVAPSVPGGAYTVTPKISVVTFGNFLGAVNGTVTGGVKSGATINAELAGTNTIIATADMLNGSPCPGGAGNCFNLSLPAAPEAGGTAYDLYVAGGLANFTAISGLVVTRGSKLTPTFNTVAISGSPNITGKIVDKISGTPIQAATVELLIPSANASPTTVVVSSTATDNLGDYTFTAVPADTYTLRVLVSGFDTLTSTATVPSSGSPTCTGSTTGCDFSLTSTTISGTVSIDTPPPSGSNVQVHVMAEDTGTGNLENDTMVTIPSGLTSTPFSIRVPATSVTAFDLIASAKDLFGGAPSPFTGHSIAVLSNVSGGASGVSLGPLDCLGHGSISGTAVSPDSGTTVRLFQLDGSAPVELSETQVGASGSTIAGQFSFCAPPGTYNLQRFENGSPVATPTGIVVPTPAPTSTPCPSICGSSSTCPGLCSNTPLGGNL